MPISKSEIVRGAAMGFALAAGLSIVVIPILVWKTEHAPEFFGAFTAAIVAAVAVVLGAFYQSKLTQQRDDEFRKRDQTGDIVEFHFWLGHAAREMEFIAGVLDRMHKRLIETAQSQLQIPPEQFREIISAHFMDELLSRAKAASKLPYDIAISIVHVLYGTYTEADRIYRLRGAAAAYRPSVEKIEEYATLAHMRAKKLEDAAVEIDVYLCTTKGIGRFIDA